MSSPKILKFALCDDETVSVSPSHEISAQEWTSISLFWSPENITAHSSRLLEVSLPIFVEKLSWIRDVWRAHGGSYEIQPELMIEAKKFKDGSREFALLRVQNTGRHANQSVTVPNLLPDRRLTPRQHENVLYLLDMPNGANFSVPGAGKTLTALCVWQVLRNRGVVDKLFVVGPRSAFESWSLEARESFGFEGVSEIYSGQILDEATEVCLVNYEQLENVKRLDYLQNWIKSNNASLVVDEAHRIKGGSKSIRWNAVRRLSSAAPRVDILTGTPMPQGPSDLAALFSAAWPKLSKQDLDERTLPLLNRNTVFVRTTKGELELPKANLVTISAEPSPLQNQIIQALNDRYGGANFLSISDAKNLAKRGKAVMTMLAAATNPGLLTQIKGFANFELGFAWPPSAISSDMFLTDLIDDYLKHEVPWKFKYVALRAEEIKQAGEKVLIWSNFVGNLASLKTILKKFQPAVIYGGVSPDDRIRELHRFRNDPNCTVLLSNPQTLGEGVSLHQVCHNEIFVDRSFNAGLYLQAVDRIHRLGLAPDQITNIELLVTRSSIDERVASRLETKIDALSDFLQDEHLRLGAIPEKDEMAPEDLLGLTDEDFADIVRNWAA